MTGWLFDWSICISWSRMFTIEKSSAHLPFWQLQRRWPGPWPFRHTASNILRRKCHTASGMTMCVICCGKSTKQYLLRAFESRRCDFRPRGSWRGITQEMTAQIERQREAAGWRQSDEGSMQHAGLGGLSHIMGRERDR
jgi:hypothetical protein